MVSEVRVGVEGGVVLMLMGNIRQAQEAFTGRSGLMWYVAR